VIDSLRMWLLSNPQHFQESFRRLHRHLKMSSCHLLKRLLAFGCTSVAVVTPSLDVVSEELMGGPLDAVIEETFGSQYCCLNHLHHLPS
jgi:hypothetical protein